MRIISGIHKSRRINPPKGLPVRPTTDFAKEGLFNILTNRISFHEIKALELFAGTGNISFELASRGAKEIIAVDADFGCINFIKKTAAELDMPIQCVKADVFKYIDFQNEPFDLIFADPPYAFSKESLEELIHKIMNTHWLTEDGILILEHSKAMDLTQVIYFQENRKYGGSVFSFFQK